MNKRQYKKYCKECYGFAVICGFIAKKQKYFGKLTQKAYKFDKNIRKERSRRRINCKVANCSVCIDQYLPW